MPKLKTNRAAKKRFRVTKGGKIKRKRSRLRHILTSKTRRQKRRLRSKGYVSGPDAKRIRRLLAIG